MRVGRSIVCVSCLLAVACGGDKGIGPAADADLPVPDSGPRADAGPFVCTVTAPTSCSDPSLRYADVKPIFEERCVLCHDGSNDNWPLTSYQHAADWFDLIPPEVVNCTMPPPEEGIPMTDEERDRLLQWYRCGFPE